MYVFDSTGDGFDILDGHRLIATVQTIEAARAICDELNDLKDKQSGEIEPDESPTVKRG